MVQDDKAARLHEAIKGAGHTWSSAALAIGKSAQAPTKWKRGQIGNETVEQLADLTRYNYVWLLTGEGPKKAGEAGPTNVIPHHPDDALPKDSIAVRVSRAKFSAGNGHHVVEFELEEESEPVIYQLAWLRREGLNPNKIRRFRVKNDSMEPFLYHDDSVLVNLAENDAARIIDGRVYALRYGDDLRIKRLYRHLDGTLVLHSDNPNYKDEIVPPELAEEHITLVGRVRDKSGTGGL